MADLKAVTRELLASGAPIQDMNTVRKHLSGHPGRAPCGRQPRAAVLAAGDLRRDRRPARRTSAPAVRSRPSTYAEANEILARFGIRARLPIARHLAAGARRHVGETPKPGDPCLRPRREPRHRHRAPEPRRRGRLLPQPGVAAMLLGDSVTGESSEVAKVYAALARQIRRHGDPQRRRSRSSPEARRR
jgi:hydroxypyruvate reductase